MFRFSEVRTDTRKYTALQLEPVRVCGEALVCDWANLSLLPTVLLTSGPCASAGGLIWVCTPPGLSVAVLGNQHRKRKERLFLYKVIS